MATLTRYTAKFYKDSTKTFYAVFIGAQENPILRVQESTLKYSYNVSSEVLSDGSTKYVLVFPKTTSGSAILLFNIEFKDGSQVKTSGEVPSDSQILVAAHDSLSFFTTFSDYDSDSKSYSISDSIYYSKSPYSILYVYPTSSVNYLDTSSQTDSYYATAGGAAYIASNDLQNSFLIGRSYSVSNIDSNQLGKFSAGKGPQSLNFSQYTDVTQKGPVVHGHTYVDSSVIPGGGTVYNVSKNAASSNYYLNGCRDKELPCIADASTFSNDCITGATLTATILNKGSNIFKDGKCSASCDGFSVKVINTKSASTLISADGSFRAEVIRGTADYTYTLASTDIGVGLTYTTVTGTSTAADINFSSLYAGRYLLTITDASSPTCTLPQVVYIDADSAESTLKGCFQAAAINYENVGAANAWDEVCVFCDATGKLIGGSDDSEGSIIGTFGSTKVRASNSTSIADTGVSNNNGRAVVDKLSTSSYNIGEYLDPYSDQTVTISFNSGDYFTGGTDYEYKLYALRGDPSTEYNVSSYLIANSALVSTTSNVSGGIMVFDDLPANHYAVRISYTIDGEDKEYEDCYIIEQFTVHQSGCTDVDASNYNPLADIDDGACRTPDTPGDSCDLNLGEYLNIQCKGATYEIHLNVNHDLVSTPAALVAAANILDPNGDLANPAHCYYAVIIDYEPGPSTTLSSATMTFNKLWQGTKVLELPCATGNLAEIASISLVFSYGGAWAAFWPDEGGPTFGPGMWTSQGPCGYDSALYLAPLYDNVDACCTVEPDPVEGCMDVNSLSYNPDATIPCPDCCTYPEILGCTDINALNYDPNATVDDGGCSYDVYGCMDPVAENYNPSATVNNNSCTYPETPCDIVSEVIGPMSTMGAADPSLYVSTTSTTSTYSIPDTACLPNSDGTMTVVLPSSAIIAAGVTDLYWTAVVSNNGVDWYGTFWNGTISPPAGSGTGSSAASLVIADGDLLPLTGTHTFTGMPSGMYAVGYSLYTNISSDGLTVIPGPDGDPTCPDLFVSGPTISAGSCPDQPVYVFGCTDISATNYNILATDDDGTCSYPNSEGCTDVFAVNYNANAQVDDGTCNYQGNACAPPVVGTCIPNTYTTNSADSVSSCCIPTDISDRLDAIEKCLAISGSRFYNKMITGLSDSCSTMEAWKMMIILEILRQKGLPCVYNCSDAATQSLSGTTCNSVWVSQGSPLWTSTGDYQTGHVVKSPVNLQYYVATSAEGLDLPPSTTVSNEDNPLSGWQRCCDEVTYSGNINYLTNFIGFAEQYCKDCELPSQLQEAPITVEVASKLSVGGVNITNNGGSFDAS